MIRKMTGLALVASAVLTLSACDWLTGKTASNAVVANETVANETVGNEMAIGNSEEGLEDNASLNVATENATLIDNAGPATNAVGGNSN